jgi:hypothetical protein
MQVYVGLNLGIDTEHTDTLAAAGTYNRNRSEAEPSDNEVLDIRPDSDKRMLIP